jgi:hypothetical protein
VVAIAANRLSAGVRPNGSLQIYAPSSYTSGLSTEHVDEDATPNELMEPFSYFNDAPPRDLTLTLAMLEDIGWELEDVPTCGDANDDGSIASSDALVALRTAVGIAECSRFACNVNASGGVTSSDALLLLRRAVGQDAAFSCPLT